MSIIARNIERQIEDDIIILLESDDYISDNNIPVRNWFDLNDEIKGRQIIVHANAGVPSLIDETGEAQEYEVKIDLLSYIHNTEDETPNSELDTLYQILVGFTEQVTIAEIQTGLVKLVINGKNTQVFAEEYDERFYTKVASFSIFVETA